MDATQNDVNSVEITGFPTLILFPRETNKMLEFSGQYVIHQIILYVTDEGNTEKENSGSSSLKGLSHKMDLALMTCMISSRSK